ncbi:uncharacterized protein BDR25DRAFT_359080 [Lindgomyces ingoldianus]|uniref:Uncharacterized protein n=1 Tax=Lindgomyces ingoldianus TaxID=673940 RepID=A0ACB6QJ55_9PLEO|nr:uncharacterized protein BDR25DRAFT_359080 [Lindgomyces ingoldianus]KAF2467029.1 hypothetical protein BDR25DRAFT_359080 [Lindgomyces ingoldianus]
MLVSRFIESLVGNNQCFDSYSLSLNLDCAEGVRALDWRGTQRSEFKVHKYLSLVWYILSSSTDHSFSGLLSYMYTSQPLVLIGLCISCLCGGEFHFALYTNIQVPTSLPSTALSFIALKHHGFYLRRRFAQRRIADEKDNRTMSPLDTRFDCSNCLERIQAFLLITDMPEATQDRNLHPTCSILIMFNVGLKHVVNRLTNPLKLHAVPCRNRLLGPNNRPIPIHRIGVISPHSNRLKSQTQKRNYASPPKCGQRVPTERPKPKQFASKIIRYDSFRMNSGQFGMPFPWSTSDPNPATRQPNSCVSVESL